MNRPVAALLGLVVAVSTTVGYARAADIPQRLDIFLGPQFALTGSDYMVNEGGTMNGATVGFRYFLSNRFSVGGLGGECSLPASEQADPSPLGAAWGSQLVDRKIAFGAAEAAFSLVRRPTGDVHFSLGVGPYWFYGDRTAPERVTRVGFNFGMGAELRSGNFGYGLEAFVHHCSSAGSPEGLDMVAAALLLHHD